MLDRLIDKVTGHRSWFGNARRRISAVNRRPHYAIRKRHPVVCKISLIGCTLAVNLVVLAGDLSAADNPDMDFELKVNATPARNLVDLSASATRLVTNEEITVTLASERRGKNPADLAKQANDDVAWATELVKQKNSVRLSSGNYQTYPLHAEKNKSDPVWQLVQEIIIRSVSVEEVTQLLGELQSRLQIRNTLFSITPDTRRRVENELVEEAMNAFRERAVVIGRAMPSADYEIVHIAVRTGSGAGPYAREAATVRMATAAAAMPPPTVEAGQTSITVEVTGSVVYP